MPVLLAVQSWRVDDTVMVQRRCSDGIPDMAMPFHRDKAAAVGTASHLPSGEVRGDGVSAFALILFKADWDVVLSWCSDGAVMVQ